MVLSSKVILVIIKRVQEWFFMINQKKSYLASPLSDNSKIGIVLFEAALLLLAGLIGLAILFFKQGLIKEIYVIVISILFILTALEINRRNNQQLAGAIIAVTLTLMVTILATIGEGIYDIGVMFYPVILILTSLILNRKSIIYLTFFIIACIGWLVFGNIYGFYQPIFPEKSFDRQFYIVSIILITTAVVTQFLSETIRKNIVIIKRELDEREKAEDALKETEELYRTMVEETSVIIYRDNVVKEGTNLYISPQIKNILGYTQAEWQISPNLWLDITHPDDLPRTLAMVEKYLETGENAICEYRMLSKDGQWIWFRDESIVVKNETGVPKYVHGVMINITEQKQAELKIKQREAILSAVAYTAQQLLKTLNWRDEINNILRMLGEATGASHVYIFENHEGTNGVMLSSIRYEWTAAGIKPELNNPIYQDTRLIPTVPGLEDWYTNLSTGKPFYGSQKQYPRYWEKVFGKQGLKTLLDVPIYVNEYMWGIIGFDDFVSEMPWSQAEIDALTAAAGNLGSAIARQHSDTALRASEEKFELAFHQTFVPMIISRGNDQMILDANEAFCRSIGYSHIEVVGHTALELNLWVDKEEQLQHQQMLTERGYAEEFKAKFRRKSGDVGVALISAITINLGNELCLLHTLYDISKIDELLNELQAKNEELQSFTYTVSHDLRAPLITISGFLGYLEEDAKKGNMERVQRDALRINEAVSKMQRLLSELLELSRIGRLMNPPENIPFGEIVQEALGLVEGRLKAKQVEIRSDAKFPIVHGDRVRLVEVVQNLVDNAAKFMGNQQHPLIEIGVKTENNKPVFFVRDNGIGIEPEQHERVFGLFNKLDTNMEGTGIGLSLVKRIVEVHGGKLNIESDGKGNGTTFYFTLSDSAATRIEHEK